MKAATFFVLLLAAASTGTAADPAARSTSAGKAKASADIVAGLAREADVRREAAASAIGNAKAALDDTQQSLLRAVRLSSPEKLTQTRKAAKNAADEFESALDTMDAIVALCAEIEDAARMARELAAQALTAAGNREGEAAATRAERLLGKAEKSLHRLTVLSDDLQKRWLAAAPVSPGG